MVHHHKSNQEVEGDPDTGHGRGMPLRPNTEELAERTAEDRQAVGLTAWPGRTSPQAQYEAEVTEVDRQVARGELPTDAGLPRKERPAFPPTRYDG